MERNYFSGLGDELYDHIEDAPKDIVSLQIIILVQLGSYYTHTDKYLGV